MGPLDASSGVFTAALAAGHSAEPNRGRGCTWGVTAAERTSSQWTNGADTARPKHAFTGGVLIFPTSLKAALKALY